MFICFSEYRIDPKFKENYLTLAAQLLKDESKVQLYEGSDQPCLYVEVRQAANLEEAEAIKEERCSERSPWHPVSSWIVGGPSKLHVWTFQPALGLGSNGR